MSQPGCACRRMGDGWGCKLKSPQILVHELRRRLGEIVTRRNLRRAITRLRRALDRQGHSGRSLLLPPNVTCRLVLANRNELRVPQVVPDDARFPRVFHRSGRPIKSFRVAFRTACAGVGCPGRVLHDFPRTAVRNLVRAAIPERVATEMTGHKTRSVFERYNIVSAGDLREAGKRLDAATGTISGTIDQDRRSGSKSEIRKSLCDNS